MIKEQDVSTSNGRQPRNRAEAVRRILAEGITSPAQIVRVVRERYGLEVTPNYVSVIKSAQADQRRTSSKPGPRRKGQQTRRQGSFQVITPTEGPVPARQVPRLSLEDLRTLVAIAERAGGVETLREFLGELRRMV